MSILDEIERDLREAELDLGEQVFTWNGVDYLCAPSTVQREVIIDESGNPVEINASIVVRHSVFPLETPPASGATITYNGANYKVMTTGNWHGKATKLFLQDENK